MGFGRTVSLLLWRGVRQCCCHYGERDHGEDFAEMHFDRWKERYLRMKARKIDLVENAEGSAGDERD